mgnify:CR=1 FL=1
MVHDPISVLDALMIALSGIVIVFLMLALLWGVIAVISRVMGVLEKHTGASGFGSVQRLRRLRLRLRQQHLHRFRRSSWKASARWRRPALWLLSATKRAFRSIQLVFKSIKAV